MLYCPKLLTRKKLVTLCGSRTSTLTSSPLTWSGWQRRRSWPPERSTATAPERLRSSLRNRKKWLISLIKRERSDHCIATILVESYWHSAHHPTEYLLGFPRNSGKREQVKGRSQVSAISWSGSEESQWTVGGNKQSGFGQAQQTQRCSQSTGKMSNTLCFQTIFLLGRDMKTKEMN